jgi:nucleoid-associated protein YgaU
MSFDAVTLPTLAPMAPVGGAVPPPPPPAPLPAAAAQPGVGRPPALPTLGSDQLVSNTYFPASPMAFYQPYPYTSPDAFDALGDVTRGMADGLGKVGNQVGQALPAIGEQVWDGTQDFGRTAVEGGKQAAVYLPGIGRGLWDAASRVSGQVADAGRWLWGGAEKLNDRLKAEYGPLPSGFYPQPASLPGYGTPSPPAVIVERGDTLRTIAQQFLGDGTRWRELYALNEPQIRAAGGLRTGIVLTMPRPSGTAPAPAPAPRPGPSEPKPSPKLVTSHTVKQGETLWVLSHRYYRDATRWRELFEANQAQIANPHKIYPGQVLKIPR